MELATGPFLAIDELMTTARAARYSDSAHVASLVAEALSLARSLGCRTREVQALRLLADAYVRLGRLEEARALLDEAVSKLDVRMPPELAGEVQTTIAYVHFRQGALAEATAAIHLALVAFRASTDRAGEAEVRNGYGLVLMNAGDYPAAVEQFHMSRAYFAARGDKVMFAGILTNLGIIHAELGDPARAMEYYEDALAAVSTCSSDPLLMLIHAQISNAQLLLSSFARALGHGEQALAIAERIAENTQAVGLVQIAKVHLQTGDIARALEFAERGVELTVRTGNTLAELQLRTLAGRVLLGANRLDTALDVLLNALQMSQTFGASTEEWEIQRSLSQVFERIGDTPSALHHMKQHVEIGARISGDQQAVRLRLLMVRLERERAELDAAELRTQHAALLVADREKSDFLLQLEEQRAALEALSLEDALTKVSNRRHLDLRLPQEFARAMRYDQPLCIALIDVDHFKSINDEYSHLAGDAVLRRIGQYLRETTRQTDIVARFGGEEFALVFMETPLVVGRALCEKVRSELATLDWSAIPLDRAVTVSIGVSATTEATTTTELVALADARLYAAKQAGRNCVNSGSTQKTVLQ